MTESKGGFKPNDDEINIADLLSLFWMKKWFIFTVTLCIFFFGALIIDKMPSIYSASSTVMIKGQQEANPLSTLINGGAQGNEQLDTTIKLLKSNQFAKKIIKQLDIPQSILNSKGTWEESDLQKLLTVNVVARTNMLEISFESKDPQFAAKVVNKISQEFILYQTELLRPSEVLSGNRVNLQIDKIKSNLLKDEQELKTFREKSNIVDIGSLIVLTKHEIAELHNAERKLVSEHERLKRLAEKMKTEKNDVLFIISNSSDSETSVIKSLFKTKSLQQAQLSQIKLRYLHKHPIYKSMVIKIADTQNQIDLEIENLKILFNTRITEVEMLLKDIKDKQQRSNKILEASILKELDYTKIKRKVTANIKLLETITTKQKEAELFVDVNKGGGVIVVDPAMVPLKPIKPKKLLLAVLSLIIGFMISIIITIIIHFFSGAHRRFRQISSFYGYKIIGELPKLRLKRKLKNKPIVEGYGKQFTVYQECMNTIRTKISLDPELSKNNLIALTSLTPNEGKSSTCIQLAKSFSELESVIIIDADLRDPSIAVALGEPRHRPGLTNLLAKTHNFDECIFRDEIINADVLTSGLRPMNPLLFLSMKRFENLLKALQEKYDRVILECPPILSVSDALMISKNVGGLTLVVDVQKNSVAKFNHDLELLAQSGTQISGVILNRIKYDAQNYYYGNYKSSLSSAT